MTQSIEPIYRIKKFIDSKERDFESLWLSEGPLLPLLKIIYAKDEADIVEINTPASLLTLYKEVTKELGNLVSSRRYDLITTTPEILNEVSKVYTKIKP